MPERTRLIAAGLVALLAAAPAAGQGKKKPSPTPTPTPAPLLKAAGSCISWVPGKHLILAEVGTTGRAFRVDTTTVVSAEVKVGARLRVLYQEGPEGPVAKRILPGPVVAPPAPKPAD